MLQRLIGRRRAAVAHLAAALLLSPALFAAWAGASLVGASVRLGGPMNVSFSGPLGAVLVAAGVAGVALVPGVGPRRAGWVLSGVLSFAAAGANLWAWPPFDDGAWFVLRLGVRDLDRAPAAAAWHLIGFWPVAIALAALPRPEPPRFALLASAAVSLAVGATALSCFASLFAAGGVWPYGVLLVLLPAAAAVILVRGHSAPARAARGEAMVLLALCTILWLLWRSVP